MINYEDWKWFKDHRRDLHDLTGEERDRFIEATLAWIIMALEPDGIVTQKASDLDVK